MAFLECLEEALIKHTPIALESFKGQQTLKEKFVIHSSQTSGGYYRKMGIGPESTPDNLLKMSIQHIIIGTRGGQGKKR
jgi:hypothetical protein